MPEEIETIAVISAPSYYRARYYDAITARYLGEDPLRFKQGMNFYGYVAGSPAFPASIWHNSSPRSAQDSVFVNTKGAPGISLRWISPVPHAFDS